MKKTKWLNAVLTLLLCGAVVGALAWLDGNASSYVLRIARLCAINMVLALSMNLINGFTGLFSLGHAGFMAIGAYVTALLTIPVAKKQVLFMIEPLVSPLDTLTLPFGATLIIGGLFIVETLSVMIQVVYFHFTHKRVFLMAPIHHHFEKKGWAETKVVIRFWIVAAAFGALGLALFFQLG